MLTNFKFTLNPELVMNADDTLFEAELNTDEYNNYVYEITWNGHKKTEKNYIPVKYLYETIVNDVLRHGVWNIVIDESYYPPILH